MRKRKRGGPVFWKSSHKAYYCEINRKQVRLGTDKEAATTEYHRLKAGHEPVTNKTSVAKLIDDFLAWTRDNRAEATYDWYHFHCQRFANYIGVKLAISELKPFHVTRWLGTLKGSSSYRNGACRAICRALNWARKQGLLDRNPIEGMERPEHQPREIYLEAEQWDQLVAAVEDDDPFIDYLWFLHETGCRPQEARIIEAKHWGKGNKLTLPRKDSKGKKYNRVIYLNERAREIVIRLALKHPSGALLRNKRGTSWQKAKIIYRFQALSKKLGFPVIAYTLRHTWITDALKRGVDVAVVARLAGHKDSTMVLRVYGHHAKDSGYLEQQLRIATNESGNDVPQKLAANG
jgi:integrase